VTPVCAPWRLAGSPSPPPWSCCRAGPDHEAAGSEVAGCEAVSAVLLLLVWLQLSTSTTDARTGLLTHDAWQAAARRALAEQASCALLIIDLDHFKRINDTHGHLVGDRLLAAVADQIRHTVGPHGVAGRFGGDEFVALLPGVDSATALRQAEALRERVATLTVPLSPHGADGRAARTTASIGLTVITPTPAEPTDTGLTGGGLTKGLWRADAALYAAKTAGRNTVRHQAGGEPWTS
jgi:diguanylate cyclase (GGDEF)-like protein